jgi:hypothetical protein
MGESYSHGSFRFYLLYELFAQGGLKVSAAQHDCDLLCLGKFVRVE